VNYSIVANVAVMILFIICIPKSNYALSFLFFVLLLIGYSICCDNNISYVIRFSLIVLFVVYAYFVKLPWGFLKIIFVLTLIQCLFLICFEAVLLLLFDSSNYLPIRHYSLEMGWGDIYYWNGYFKIQVKGNALIPLVYMLSYVYDVFPLRNKKKIRALYLISIIIAGNFAFLIALFLFHVVFYVYNVRNNNQLGRRIFYLLVLLFFLSPFLLVYLSGVLNLKTDSLGTRWDQADVLLTDLMQNPFFILFGKGLGNTVSIQTVYRDYTDNIYFELQTVYFLNQMGVLFFTLFLLFNVFLSIKFMNDKKILLVYACYIIYAITNPYILDTNQVVVILVLVSLNSYSRENRLCISTL